MKINTLELSGLLAAVSRNVEQLEGLTGGLEHNTDNLSIENLQDLREKLNIRMSETADSIDALTAFIESVSVEQETEDQ